MAGFEKGIFNNDIIDDESYKSFYKETVENAEEYWANVASELKWFKKWDKAYEGDIANFRFFVNGFSNVSMNCIDVNAEKNPDKKAIIWLSEDNKERTLTYKELLKEVSKFSIALLREGIKKGDVVALYISNLPEAFIAVHACYRIGAIYNIIFSGFSPMALLERLNDAQPKLIVTQDQAIRHGKIINLKENLDSIIDNVKSLKKAVIVKRTGNPVKMNDKDMYYDDFIKNTAEFLEPVPIEANDPGFIIYTSGTTSKPKGIVHSGIGFLVGSYYFVKYSLNLNKSDIYWCTADIGWLTFPIYELVGALAHDATVIAYDGVLDYPSIGHFYSIIEKYRVNKLFTAPTFLRILARNGEEIIKKHDISSLKLISLVGEPIDIKTWYWIYNNFNKIEINNTYGQTETGGAWTSSIINITKAVPGSCGLPLPAMYYEILDDSGKRVKRGEKGNLALKMPFPSLARDIYHNHQKYLETYFYPFKNYYLTYDEAFEDENNHIWVTGRTDDVINVSGHRLSTMEMENSIMSVNNISEAAAIGIDDELKGTVPVIFATLKKYENIPEIKNAINKAITGNIGKIAIPGKIYIVSEMPKTRSGKIMRRLLRELLAKGAVSGDITGLENPGSIEIIRKEINLQ
ncbi:MAG: acetate--CoA ligase [Ferroplasma sp.]